MKEPEQKRPREPGEHELAPELARTLEHVGPSNYALATAREFTKGGKYSSERRRPRFAKT